MISIWRGKVEGTSSFEKDVILFELKLVLILILPVIELASEEFFKRF